MGPNARAVDGFSQGECFQRMRSLPLGLKCWFDLDQTNDGLPHHPFVEHIVHLTLDISLYQKPGPQYPGVLLPNLTHLHLCLHLETRSTSTSCFTCSNVLHVLEDLLPLVNPTHLAL